MAKEIAPAAFARNQIAPSSFIRLLTTVEPASGGGHAETDRRCAPREPRKPGQPPSPFELLPFRPYLSLTQSSSASRSPPGPTAGPAAHDQSANSADDLKRLALQASLRNAGITELMGQALAKAIENIFQDIWIESRSRFSIARSSTIIHSCRRPHPPPHRSPALRVRPRDGRARRRSGTGCLGGGIAASAAATVRRVPCQPTAPNADPGPIGVSWLACVRFLLIALRSQSYSSGHIYWATF